MTGLGKIRWPFWIERRRSQRQLFSQLMLFYEAVIGQSQTLDV